MTRIRGNLSQVQKSAFFGNLGGWVVGEGVMEVPVSIEKCIEYGK